jgi:hypothetical protein
MKKGELRPWCTLHQCQIQATGSHARDVLDVLAAALFRYSPANGRLFGHPISIATDHPGPPLLP